MAGPMPDWVLAGQAVIIAVAIPVNGAVASVRHVSLHETQRVGVCAVFSPIRFLNVSDSCVVVTSAVGSSEKDIFFG